MLLHVSLAVPSIFEEHISAQTNHSRFIHSLFDEHLGCFQFAVTTNDVVTSACLQVFV